MIKGNLDGTMQIKIKDKEVFSFTAKDKTKEKLKSDCDVYANQHGYEVHVEVHSTKPRYHYTICLVKIGTEPPVNWWNLGKGL